MKKIWQKWNEINLIKRILVFLVLGAVLGVVEGVLWVLVAVTIVHFVALSSPADALISQASLDNSLLVKHLDAINPVVGFMDRAVDTLMASLSLS